LLLELFYKQIFLWLSNTLIKIEYAIDIQTAGGQLRPKFSLFFVTFVPSFSGIFSITHIVCSKLPRFGHQMAGQMQQTAVKLNSNCKTSLELFIG